MKNPLSVLLLALSLINTLHAITDVNVPSTRIQALLPSLTIMPSVEPYLPNNYILIQSQSTNEYFWGPIGLGRTFMENPNLITAPVIHVITQSGFKSFNQDMKEVLFEMQKEFPTGFQANFSQWGGYPLVSIKMKVGFDAVYMAYVSLGDKEGNILIFHLMYPNKIEYGNNKPSRDDLRLWENFLELTKPLR